MKDKISISIAVKERENFASLRKCLRSLDRQTYKKFEVILVGKNLKDFIFKFRDKKISIKKLTVSVDKNEARNVGFMKSQGIYFLYLDHDMQARNNLLEDCMRISSMFDAVIIPEKGVKGGFWVNCRKLEKELITYDLDTVTPRFFKKSILGSNEMPFDKRFGLLDEWGFNVKIKNKKVRVGISKSSLVVSNKDSIMLSIKNKFLRGLWMKNFYKIDSEEAWRRIDPVKRGIVFYSKHVHYLLKDPLHFVGLILLKSIDLIAFLFGYLVALMIFKNLFSKRTIQTYDNFGNLGENYFKMYKGRNWNRYVDEREKQEVERLWNLNLDKSLNKQRILDLGMGPGRWSIFFLSYGFQSITGLEISPGMMEYTKGEIKDKRFKAILGSMDDLKFPDNYYNKVFCFRAIKYVPDYQKALQEMSRVLVKNGTLIVEISNKSLLNQFFRFLSTFVIFANFNLKDKTVWGYFNNVHFFSKREISDLIENAGLSVVSINPLFVLPSIRFPAILDKYLAHFFISSNNLAIKILPKEKFARSWVVLAKK